MKYAWMKHKRAGRRLRGSARYWAYRAAAFCSGVIVHRASGSSPIELSMRKWRSFMLRESKAMAAFASLAGCVSQECVSALRECAKAYCGRVCARCIARNIESQRTRPIESRLPRACWIDAG